MFEKDILIDFHCFCDAFLYAFLRFPQVKDGTELMQRNVNTDLWFFSHMWFCPDNNYRLKTPDPRFSRSCKLDEKICYNFTEAWFMGLTGAGCTSTVLKCRALVIDWGTLGSHFAMTGSKGRGGSFNCQPSCLSAAGGIRGHLLCYPSSWGWSRARSRRNLSHTGT